jgi:hypothetical protein
MAPIPVLNTGLAVALVNWMLCMHEENNEKNISNNLYNNNSFNG